jgi:chloride channel 6
MFLFMPEQIKAYLNGTNVPRFLGLKCFIATLLGTIMSVSSGLVVGPEGPLVHLGAMIGAHLARLSDWLDRKLEGKQVSVFHNPCVDCFFVFF